MNPAAAKLAQLAHDLGLHPDGPARAVEGPARAVLTPAERVLAWYEAAK